MFPHQIMDKLLKLKLELAYKDMSVEQARQLFHELTEVPVVTEVPEVPEPPKIVKTSIVKRKRIPGKK